MIQAAGWVDSGASQLPVAVTIRSSAISLSGTVMMREVNPDPAPVVVVTVRSAPKIRSFALVVVAAPLLAEVLLPVAAAVTSKGLVVAIPLYSRMRISGYAAAVVNVTVTVLAFAAAPTMPAV